MIKVEFHTHTNYSHDSILNKYLYLVTLKVKGIKAIAITDHNTAEGSFYYKPFLQKYGIKVITGEEIFTSEGEIIGLFLTKTIKPGMTPEETVNEIKSQGGLVYIPHPYDEKRKKTVLKEEAIERLKNSIDLIETHNGRNVKEFFSIKQREISEKYGIPPVTGSDAHTFIELGRNYVEIEDFETPKELLENMKSSVHTRRNTIIAAHHITKFVRIMKLAAAGKFNEIFGIIKRKFKHIYS